MISITWQYLPCVSKCWGPWDQSSVPIPGFGPPVAQQLESGHLLRCEVPSQEVHGVFGEVRGDDWTHQVWTPITLQHLWTHTKWLCPLLSTLKAWNHAQRSSPSLLTPVRMARQRFGCDGAHNRLTKTRSCSIEFYQKFPYFCKLINHCWHVSTSQERWNGPLQWATYYATCEHPKPIGANAGDLNGQIQIQNKQQKCCATQHLYRGTVVMTPVDLSAFITEKVSRG